MTQFKDSRERVEALLAAAEATMRRRFARAVEAAREALPQEEVERLIAEGRQDEIVRRYREVAAEVARAFQEAFLLVANSTTSEIGRQIGRSLAFDVSVDRASRALREERSRIVAGLVETQRLALYMALATAARRGAGLEAQATAARASLGLTQRQVTALQNYRDALARSAAVALDRELGPEEPSVVVVEEPSRVSPTVDEERMAESYRGVLFASGAVSLAVFEAQQAVHEGTDESLAQLYDSGELDPSTEEDTWWTARDERVRQSHRAMHGQKRPPGVPFRSGDGNLLRYPGDELAPASDTARCRCIVTRRASVSTPVGVA
jgi:hypothetical protein